jgi:hypothetical protein
MWHMEWKPNHPIYQRLSESTITYLKEQGKDILEWFWDSQKLIDQFKVNDGQMSDYSFLIAPAYKGLEKWLLITAPYLGVPQNIIDKATKTGKLGLFLQEEPMQAFLDDVLSKLDKTTDKKKELRSFAQSLHSTFKTFRHNPAHSSLIIENPLKAETDFLTLLNIVDNFTKEFIEENIIPNAGRKLDSQLEARKRLANLAS